MEKSYTMSIDELARARKQAEDVNLKLKRKDGSSKNDLGRDSFLKLLVTELKHQDPTQPMADREFISQMAQFSTLEKMTSINTAIQLMNRSAMAGEAYGLLGKKVQAFNQTTGTAIEGVVSKIFYRENEVRLVVDSNEISLSDIHAVFPHEEKKINDPKGIQINHDINKVSAVKAYGRNEKAALFVP